MDEYDDFKNRFEELLDSKRKTKSCGLSLHYKVRKTTNDSQVAIFEDNDHFFIYTVDFLLKSYKQIFEDINYYIVLERFCDEIIDRYTTSYSPKNFDTPEW